MNERGALIDNLIDTLREKATVNAKLGVTVGSVMNPRSRFGRVTGLIHGADAPHRFVVREFRDDDADWPTGEYSRWALVVPWEEGLADE